jgi:hypothetical protein
MIYASSLLRALSVCTQIQYEAVFPIHLPLVNAPHTRKHACSGQWIR